MMKDYYQILGIGSNATEEQIKSAYRTMAMQWHPDKNPDKDTTEKMKVINEAYTILSNPESKCRYDEEYLYFKYAHTAGSTECADDYDIKDENLKRDVNNARMSAEEFAKNFYTSFKADSKSAANGALDAAKPYLVFVAVMSVIGIIVSIGWTATSYKENETEAVKQLSIEARKAESVPEGWRTYEFGTDFKISVPPTVELRSDSDEYTKTLNKLNLNTNKDYIIFQQAGLAQQSPEATKKYCRIMIEYLKGDYGDYLKSTETEYLDTEWESVLHEFVTGNIGPVAKQMGTTQYKWVTINGAKAIQVDYKRSGMNFDTSIPVVCRVGFFQNNNEMLIVTLSYREAESSIWAEDFNKVFETIKWL